MSATINDRDVWLGSFLSRFEIATVVQGSQIGMLQATGAGLSIAAAKKMDLVATSQAFTTANGSTEPPVILLSPTLRNLTGPPSYFVVSGSATLTASGDAAQVFFNSMSNRVTIRASITDGSTNYIDQITLVKLSTTSGVVPLLTNEHHSLLADPFGNVLNYIGGSGTFRVWDGVFEVTPACEFSIVTNAGNLLIELTNLGQYSVTGIPANIDNADVVLRARYNNTNYDLTFTVVKIKAAAGTAADPSTYTAGGLRLPTKTSVPVGSTVWSNATATALYTSVGGPVLNDVCTEYNNTSTPPFKETRFYAAGTWNTLNASIDGNLIVTGTIGTDKLAANSVTADKLAIGVVSASITPGMITGTMIEDGTITTEKILANAITTELLASGAITADKIAVGAIAGNAPGSITGTMIANGTITTGKIAANAITTGLLAAGSVTADRIAVGVISNVGGPGTITGTMLANGTITTAQIAANAIATAQIAAGAITADRIAVGVISNVGGPGTITGTMIANGTITTAKIAANQITAALIAGGTITADKIAVGVIPPGTNVGQPGSITGTMIADGTITTANLAVNSISADRIIVGTITADRIVFKGLGTNQLAAGSVTSNAVTAFPSTSVFDGGEYGWVGFSCTGGTIHVTFTGYLGSTVGGRPQVIASTVMYRPDGSREFIQSQVFTAIGVGNGETFLGTIAMSSLVLNPGPGFYTFSIAVLNVGSGILNGTWSIVEMKV